MSEAFLFVEFNRPPTDGRTPMLSREDKSPAVSMLEIVPALFVRTESASVESVFVAVAAGLAAWVSVDAAVFEFVPAGTFL